MEMLPVRNLLLTFAGGKRGNNEHLRKMYSVGSLYRKKHERRAVLT